MGVGEGGVGMVVFVRGWGLSRAVLERLTTRGSPPLDPLLPLDSPSNALWGALFATGISQSQGRWCQSTARSGGFGGCAN